MKRTVPMLLVSVGLAFASSSAFALGDCKTGTGPFCQPKGGGGGTGQTPVSAPEIDAGSGARAIALLVASLMLVGEGLRRRRS